jgi:hypothetical protein
VRRRRTLGDEGNDDEEQEYLRAESIILLLKGIRELSFWHS